jgi:hypothetical protein
VTRATESCTTSSEWLGDLRAAARRSEARFRLPPDIRARLARVNAAAGGTAAAARRAPTA